MHAKVPTGEWLRSKLDRLTEMTTLVSKDNFEEISEPDYGFWSIKKEIALMYWIWPFLQIASKHFDSFYYIDLFAGSGLMKADEVSFVGSPIVAIGSTLPDKKFSQYICLEVDQHRKLVLEKRAAVACKHFGTCDAKIFQFYCNVELDSILKENCPSGKTCFLAFVDPQKITDFKWTTLHKLLTHGKGDIILNFPTMAILRNLRVPESESALDDYFGDGLWCQVEPNAEEILGYFMRKILFYRNEVDSLPVKDEQNRRLYDLIFATGSRGMRNVLGDLKNRLNSIKTRYPRAILSSYRRSKSTDWLSRRKLILFHVVLVNGIAHCTSICCL
jgi:three-Cys-motif partner protein